MPGPLNSEEGISWVCTTDIGHLILTTHIRLFSGTTGHLQPFLQYQYDCLLLTEDTVELHGKNWCILPSQKSEMRGGRTLALEL